MAMAILTLPAAVRRWAAAGLVEAGGGDDDAVGAVDELGVGGLDIDHEVAVDVLPVWIMTPVESMLRTSLVAVPALRRVEPVRTSGPVSGGDGDVGDGGRGRSRGRS